MNDNIRNTVKCEFHKYLANEKMDVEIEIVEDKDLKFPSKYVKKMRLMNRVKQIYKDEVKVTLPVVLPVQTVTQDKVAKVIVNKKIIRQKETENVTKPQVIEQKKVKETGSNIEKMVKKKIIPAVNNIPKTVPLGRINNIHKDETFIGKKKKNPVDILTLLQNERKRSLSDQNGVQKKISPAEVNFFKEKAKVDFMKDLELLSSIEL
jgi:hypothetical protein